MEFAEEASLSPAGGRKSRMDLVVVQYPDFSGDLGTWAVPADSSSSCSSSSAVNLQEEKKPRNMETSAPPASQTQF